MTISFRLEKEAQAKFSALCKSQGLSQSEMLRDMVDQIISQQPELPFDDQPETSAPAEGGGGRDGQDVRSNTAHLYQNGTNTSPDASEDGGSDEE